MSKRLIRVKFDPTNGTHYTNCGVYATTEAAIASCIRREDKQPIKVQETTSERIGVFFYAPETEWLGGYFYLILRPDDNAYGNVTHLKDEVFGVVLGNEDGTEEWVAGGLASWEEAVSVCNRLTEANPDKAYLPAKF